MLNAEARKHGTRPTGRFQLSQTSVNILYEEVEFVCASLKAGISGVENNYGHIRFAGPPFWKLLFQQYQDFL